MSEPIGETPASDPTTTKKSPAANFLLKFGCYLYNSNPFYAISAALMLAGLNLMFRQSALEADPTSIGYDSWLLLQALGGYAMLLALAAILIVRVGKVWNDARTIICSLLILFVGMSVSFDHLALANAAAMKQVLAVGFLFTVLLAEALLRGLQIRLPALFRGPLYLILGQFFLYPIVLLYLLDTVGDVNNRQGLEGTLLAILLFPAAAGIAVLTLLPAVQRGPDYVADNGTPWKWPLFPWSLFVFLGVGIVLRSYYLTLSFHPHSGFASGFGLYFLTPLALSIALVLFEMGRTAKSSGLQTIAVAAPLTLLPFSLPGYAVSHAFHEFLALYVNTFGSPIQIACYGALLLQVYAWLRGHRPAYGLAVVLLVFASVIDRGTRDLGSLAFPSVWSLAAAAALTFRWAIARPQSSLRWFVTGSLGIAAATAGAWNTQFLAFGLAAPFHVLLLLALLLGVLLTDGFARFLRDGGAAAQAALALAAVTRPWPLAEFGDLALVAYLVAQICVGCLCWHVGRSKAQVYGAGILTACLFGLVGRWISNGILRTGSPIAAVLVLGGLATFLLALLISLLKAGLLRPIRRLLSSVDRV